MRNIAAGSITLSVERAISAFDEQDRSINSGAVNIVWGYGTGSDVLTSGVRNGAHVTLFDNNMTLPTQPRPMIPDDAWGNQTILATGYAVPKAKSSFACTAVSATVPYGYSTSLIAFDNILATNNNSAIVQSMVLYACPSFEQFPYMKETIECGTNFVPRPSVFCSDVLYRWAPGMGRFVLPPNVGFKLNEDNRYLVLETRYENTRSIDGVVDKSGVMYHYSKDPRPFAAGTLILGDSLGSLRGKSVAGNYGGMVSSSCPSMCTKQFQDSIKIFAASPEMGSFGHSIMTLKHSNHSTGGYLVSYWSKSRQSTYFLPQPVQMKAGDQLSTTCVYDTRKKPDTKFGTDLHDEVCVDYLFYYPRQDLSNVAGLPVLTGNLDRCGFSSSSSVNGTICGRKVVSTRKPNTPLNITGAYNDTFGTAPEVCYLAKPKPTPQSRSVPEQRRACFPSDAQVKLHDGRSITMAELDLGHQVLSQRSMFTTVFAFTHRQSRGLYEFVMIKAGNHTLHLSAGHYIYANSKLIPAKDVVVGDMVEDENGLEHQVTAIRKVLKEGLFNPQTITGTIVVNGIKVSCYTTAVAPTIAHASLTFLRALFATTRLHFLSIG